MGRSALLVALAFAAGCGSTATAPKATAHRISSRSELIGGPKALGKVGDYLIANDKIRVIVQGLEDYGGRGVTLFPGSIIDADLVRPGGGDNVGNDELGEILPSFLLEAMDPTSITVVADGKDGGPASIEIEGKGDDLIQMVAVLNEGLLFPPDLTFKETLTLEPGKSYVELTTSITNHSGSDHPLPYLNPADLQNLLGPNVPNVSSLQMAVPMGHLLLFGGENQTFTPGTSGFNLRFAIEDSYKLAQGFPAFPGMVTEWLATRGTGVSYGFAIPDSPDNYATSVSAKYAPQPTTTHSLVAPYVYAGVTGVFAANPPPLLTPGQSWAWTSWFIVGRGDVASVADVIHELHGIATGTFAGRVVDAHTNEPVVGLPIVITDVNGAYVDEVDTFGGGGFKANLPPGAYTYRLVGDTRPTSDPVAFDILAGKTTTVMPLAPAAGAISVSVTDEQGRRAPCKIQLVGKFDDSHLGQDPRTFLYDLHLGERQRATTFDPTRDDYIENAWYTTDGQLATGVRPGTYTIVASRGIEYDAATQTIVVPPGGTAAATLALHRAIDTTGYVGADLHVHSANSVDSGMALPARVTSIAGEGLEFVAATDHNVLTDYGPIIAQLGLQPWLTSTVGMELTTFEMGHFNGYPLRYDPASPRGGDFTWGGKSPDQLFDQLRGLAADPNKLIVEVNHPRDGVLGYFQQFNLNDETGDVMPRQGLRAILAPYKPEFQGSAFSYDFDALEVLNGKRFELTHTYRAPAVLPPPPYPMPPPAPGDIVRDANGNIAYPGQVDDWFTLLNRGLTYTGVGNSDSHAGFLQEPGYPRNEIWLGPGKDAPGLFTPGDVVDGLKSHRVVMTNGPMIDFTVDGSPIGALVKGGAQADVKIHVTSAGFSPVTHVRVWMNGQPAFDVDVPGAESHDFSVEQMISTPVDCWLIVEATGTANMFPVIPPEEFEPQNIDAVIDALGKSLNLSALSPAGNLKPPLTFPITPIALTNPIWIDTDGNGKFDSPLPPVPNIKGTVPVGKPDVRKSFHDIQEIK